MVTSTPGCSVVTYRLGRNRLMYCRRAARAGHTVSRSQTNRRTTDGWRLLIRWNQRRPHGNVQLRDIIARRHSSFDRCSLSRWLVAEHRRAVAGCCYCSHLQPTLLLAADLRYGVQLRSFFRDNHAFSAIYEITSSFRFLKIPLAIITRTDHYHSNGCP